jgi:mycothiol synthase
VVQSSRVRPVDPTTADDSLLVQIHELLRASHGLAAPEDPFAHLDETLGWLRFPPASEPRLHWTVDEPVAGYAALTLPSGSRTGYVRLAVDPQRRRLGLGRDLLAIVVQATRRAGRASVIGSYADAAGATFSAAVGALPGQREIRSVLREADAAGAAPGVVPGYSLRSWCGPAPAELLESYARARTAIQDAPSDDPDDGGAWTPEIVRDLEASVARRGRQVRLTVALDARAEVVAFTELRVSPDPGAVARTEDTAVRADHRGRGLATWIKRESLRLLRADRPDIRLVSTTNAESNAPMLAVNRKLGFAPVATWTNAVLNLTGERLSSTDPEAR